MRFDVYFPFKNKEGKLCPGVKPRVMTWSEIREFIGSKAQCDLIGNVRLCDGEARAEAKKHLPAVTFCGCTDKTRAARHMRPTDLVMIDIDHCASPKESFDELYARWASEGMLDEIVLVYITPSGRGLRIVFRAQPGKHSLEENMAAFSERYDLGRFGDVDMACKDFSRLSFLPYIGDVLYESPLLTDGINADINRGFLENAQFGAGDAGAQPAGEGEKRPAGELFSDAEAVGSFTDAETQEFENYDYKGTPVKVIIEKWVETHGEPGRGEIHNYYNDMVKNFRNIVSNNKRALLYLLPRFGHSASECWSSIVSICRVNTLSSLPKPFYFFLKDNGFYKKSVLPQGGFAEYMLGDETAEADDGLPWMPPVFREFVKVTPRDFVPSVINALLPIMGTLTSYLKASYYYDGRTHTTSFFSIVYAPAGTGKGFVERLLDRLFADLRMRDYVQQARENIYLNTLQRKGANEKSPDSPHTSLRLIPPKNSEAEFLQKQKDNQGYHMFTYAAEMDSWAKGVKAAGGNKDDMIRIAWDNGEYGQQFKSAATFKGVVNLYWNVLITGTIQQVMQYFKNVENGLITRCSFTTIDNQEFAAAPRWRQLSKKDLQLISRFTERCDRNSYTEPCTIGMEDVDAVSSEKFDDEVPWRFVFRPRRNVDMEWLRPCIEEFLDTQLKKAALDLDKARDVFRRRVAVRGFRLGMICYALWEKPRTCDLEKCIPFIRWWMDQDLESSLKLWGARYNNEVEEMPNLNQRSLFNNLSQAFSKSDVYALCMRQGIKTPVRQIIYQWAKLGYVKKISKNEYEKTDKKL